MKQTTKSQKTSELSNIVVIDKEASTMVDIEPSRITLIGGLIHSTVPTVEEAAGQASKLFTKVRPILPFTQRSDAWVSEQYKRVIKSTDEELFLNTLQIADNNIEEVNLDVDSAVRIYRGSASEELVKADHVLHRLAQVAFSLINHKFLAIAEIENGLYASSYEELWIHLFEMSSLLEAQVIATTHSTKMIEAFAKVSQSLNKEKYYSPSTYIELARKDKTGELIATKIAADTVLYALDHCEDIQGGMSGTTFKLDSRSEI
jgi:hypothetical protein